MMFGWNCTKKVAESASRINLFQYLKDEKESINFHWEKPTQPSYLLLWFLDVWLPWSFPIPYDKINNQFDYFILVLIT